MLYEVITDRRLLDADLAAAGPGDLNWLETEDLGAPDGVQSDGARHDLSLQRDIHVLDADFV